MDIEMNAQAQGTEGRLRYRLTTPIQYLVATCASQAWYTTVPSRLCGIVNENTSTTMMSVTVNPYYSRTCLNASIPTGHFDTLKQVYAVGPGVLALTTKLASWL